MTQNTSLISKSIYERYLSTCPNEMVKFLDQNSVIALSKTCEFVNEFFQNEGIRKILTAIHFPHHVLPAGCTYSEYYARLVAAHSPTPGVDRSDILYFTDRLCDMVFTLDGKKVITAIQSSYDKVTIAIYDLATKKPQWMLDLKMGGAKFQIFPKGNKLLIYGHSHPGTVLNYVDLETGDLLHTFETEDKVRCTAISSNEEILYAGLENQAVKQWNLTTKKEILYRLPVTHSNMHIGGIIDNGRKAVIMDVSGNLQLWKFEKGKFITLQKEEDDHLPPRFFFRASLDQKSALFFCQRQIIKEIWDLSESKRKYSCLIPGSNLFHITPDFKCALSASDHHLTRLDLETGRGLEFNTASPSQAIQIKSDGTGALSVHEHDRRYCLSYWDFSALPSSRLSNRDFHQLPQFVQNEIIAISPTLAKGSINSYAATLLLPPIRRLYLQAQRQPNLATTLVTEAVARISQLPPAIEGAIYRHLEIIQRNSTNDAKINNTRPMKRKIPGNPESAEGVKDAPRIQAGIEAITRTIDEFIAKRKLFPQ